MEADPSAIWTIKTTIFYVTVVCHDKYQVWKFHVDTGIGINLLLIYYDDIENSHIFE